MTDPNEPMQPPPPDTPPVTAPTPATGRHTTASFGLALVAMKHGKKTHRPGGQHIGFQQPNDDHPLGTLYVETGLNSVAVYSPTTTDVLAEDWTIID